MFRIGSNAINEKELDEMPRNAESVLSRPCSQITLMGRTPPNALKLLISVLVIVVVVFALIVAIISVGLGYVPSWALYILIGSLIAFVIIRIVAMVGFDYPPYDFSRIYEQNRDQNIKKK